VHCETCSALRSVHSIQGNALCATVDSTVYVAHSALHCILAVHCGAQCTALYTVHCARSAMWHCTIYCALCTVCCALHSTVQCSAHCVLCRLCSAVSTALFAVECSVHCADCTAQCRAQCATARSAQYTVQCTVRHCERSTQYSVQCNVRQCEHFTVAHRALRSGAQYTVYCAQCSLCREVSTTLCAVKSVQCTVQCTV